MNTITTVMAGLDPATRVFGEGKEEDVDARHKAGHDGDREVWEFSRPVNSGEKPDNLRILAMRRYIPARLAELLG